MSGQIYQTNAAPKFTLGKFACGTTAYFKTLANCTLTLQVTLGASDVLLLRGLDGGLSEQCIGEERLVRIGS